MMDQRQACNEARAAIEQAQKMMALLIDSREKSLAQTKLDEASMWLDKLYFKERLGGGE